MNWIECIQKVLETDENKVMLAPFTNIAGCDIRFDKGYGTLKIIVPADIADDLTNGSRKYVGGLLLVDKETYDRFAKGGEEE